MSNLTDLAELVDYDPVTGALTWRVDRPRCRCYAGTSAVRVNRDGYGRVGFRDKSFLAHRLAWTKYYGEEPAGCLDHANGIRIDNRISNLRLASGSQNAANRSSLKGDGRLKGVCQITGNRFRAQVKYRGKTFNLGTFQTLDDAHRAYLEKAREVYGEFARGA